MAGPLPAGVKKEMSITPKARCSHKENSLFLMIPLF